MTRVLVTGATGFIASHAVAALLLRGYEVRGTVRSRQRALREAALAHLPGAERLELVEADLLDAASFAAPARDCAAVLHIASPYAIDVKDAQRDLIAPAVQGTEAVLAAAAAAGVRRVVLTSSMAAVTDEPPRRALTEADWNEKSSLARNPYYFSKVQAERAAWGFVKEKKPGFDLVVINPALVAGPSYTRALNESNKLLADLTKGVFPGILDLTWGFVDVRDVPEAHARALETPAAAGRYICSGDVLTMRETLAALRAALPGAKLPRWPLDNIAGAALAKLASYTQPAGVGAYLRTNLGRKLSYDNTKIRRELGMSFRPATAVIADAAADMVKWGHIQV